MGFLFKILPQKTIPLLVISGLVVALALVRTPSKTGNKINEVTSNPTIKSGQEEINTDTDSNSNDSSQGSTTNKIDVSVNTNTSDGVANGSADVQITNDNETQTFSKSVNNVSGGSSFSVNVNQGDVRFDTNLHKHTVNRSSTDQEIKITSKSHL